MKITRKEDKFILGSTVVDSTVLKGTPGLEKQLLTNALNLLKFPQRFGLTQDKGKELKFTSDIEQSGRILDVFSDAVWEYNPKTTVYEKKGKLSEVFNNKSIIFNENTGKTYYLKDGKFKKISDLNFKVSRGDEVVRELENRVQDVEKRMGDSGNRFSIVSALPANPDKDTLYIVVGEGQIEDTELQGMDLTELTAKISECITSNLNMSLQVKELQAGEDAQNARMEEINGSFGAIEDGIADNKTEITSLKSRMSTAETGIAKVQSDLSTANTALSGNIQKNATDIAKIQDDLENLASSDTITALESRIDVAETDITAIKSKNTIQDEDIALLKTKVESLEGVDTDYQEEIDNLKTSVQGHTSDIADIKETISSLGSNAAIVELGERIDGVETSLGNLETSTAENLQTTKTAILDTVSNRVQELNTSIGTNTSNITALSEKLDNLGTEDIEGLQEFIENNSGHIEIVEELPQEPEPETLYLITTTEEPKKITYQDLVDLRNSNVALSELINEKTNKLSGDIDTVRTDVNKNKSDISNLQDTQTQHTTDIETCKDDIETNKTSISNLAESVQMSVQTIQDNFAGVQSAITGLTNVAQTQNDALTEAQATIKAQKTQIEGLEARIQLLEAKLDMIDFDTLSLGGVDYDLVIKKGE